MATIKVKSNYSYKLDSVNFSELLLGRYLESASSIAEIAYGRGKTAEFKGSGFKYGDDGIPTAGTVNSYAILSQGDVKVSFSGFSVGAARLSSAAKTGGRDDDVAALKSMLSKNDRFEGGARSDSFNAYDGNDRLDGKGGVDKLAGGKGRDTILGGAGEDQLKGEADRDTLSGGDGADRLWGGNGNDRIAGGKGGDKLWGGDGKKGSGNDTFVFTSLSESTVKAAGRDTIYDFSKGDRFDLLALDANGGKSKNQAFKFIGDDAFSGKAGELRFDLKKSDTYVYADTDGDGKANFSFHLDDAVKLAEADFLL